MGCAGKFTWPYIYHFTSTLHGLIRTHKWPAPNVSSFIAQLVRASHWYCEVTGSNPVEVLTFPGFYIRNCLNCVHNCEDHNLLNNIDEHLSPNGRSITYKTVERPKKIIIIVIVLIIVIIIIIIVIIIILLLLSLYYYYHYTYYTGIRLCQMLPVNNC